MARSIYGLIGYPLGHSLSRVFFTEKFNREGIDAEYRMWSLPELRTRADLPAEEGLRGFNVTIPYKRRVMDLLDEVDDVAAGIGAVNVVKVECADGRRILKGYNTDAGGFLKSLLAMPGFREESRDMRALVLGSGGVSRAVIHALGSIGIESDIVSRSAERGALRYEDLNEEVMRSRRLIVNCTPLGTYPKTGEAPPIPYGMIGEGHYCHDLVYNPSRTRFMELCGSQGAEVKNGAEMLRNQAEGAWEIWTGSGGRPDVTDGA